MKELRLKELCYGIEEAITRPLSFSLQKGESIRISGSNGIGKSLLLKTIVGIHAPLSGSVTNDLSTAYLPQLQSKATHLPFSLHEVISASEQEILSLGLLEKRHLPLAWNHASGGERQRTLLTKLFLSKADLFILDEPMNHLDINSQETVRTRLKSIQGKTALLFVSHEHTNEHTNDEWIQCKEVINLDLWRLP